jgi:MFS family permease
MEAIILGWYVLVQTDSAFLVSVIGALRFGGTLIAPATGVLADRISRRSLLVMLRVCFAVLAGSVVVAAFAGSLPLAWVFVVAGVAGLLRPSEMILRQSLIADMVPRALLTNALGFGRATMESARVAGPLIGAGLFSALGIALAYAGVTAMYLVSAVASVFVPPPPRRAARPAARPWADLTEGLRYIRGEPLMVACLLLAFLVNFTAFPVSLGLLPVIARDVFGADENGLARMVATVAIGALTGSVLTATVARNLRPERAMLICLAAWHVLIIAFAVTDSLPVAYVLLALIGLATSGGMIPIAVVLMTHADPDYRGRVMGVRMLAVYGLPLGLMAAGALIEWIGITPTLVIYGTAGLVPILAVMVLWSRWTPAAANR